MNENGLKAAGIDASDIGAVMDGKGVAEVTRNPASTRRRMVITIRDQDKG